MTGWTLTGGRDLELCLSASLARLEGVDFDRALSWWCALFGWDEGARDEPCPCAVALVAAGPTSLCGSSDVVAAAQEDDGEREDEGAPGGHTHYEDSEDEDPRHDGVLIHHSDDSFVERYRARPGGIGLGPSPLDARHAVCCA